MTSQRDRTVSGTDVVCTTTGDGVLVLEFDGQGHNTFPTEKMERLAALIGGLSEDPDTRALVLFAGKERSFGVGGDFNEVSTFTGGSEVTRWIDACVDMYRSVLTFPRPTVAAVDGYCIGIGLQLALCADWRVATSEADLRMPELKLGISCILGAPLLYDRVSPFVANRMIIGCDAWNSEAALRDGLVDELSGTDVLAASLERARNLATYERVPMARTKTFINNQLVIRMEQARIAATEGHRAGFAASSSAQNKMRTVLAGHHT